MCVRVCVCNLFMITYAATDVTVGRNRMVLRTTRRCHSRSLFYLKTQQEEQRYYKHLLPLSLSLSHIVLKMSVQGLHIDHKGICACWCTRQKVSQIRRGRYKWWHAECLSKVWFVAELIVLLRIVHCYVMCTYVLLLLM